VKVWERARDFLEGLDRETPGRAFGREQLAWAYASLVELHRQSGRLEEAVKACERARDIWETQVRANPGSPFYWVGLVRAHTSLDELYRQFGRPEEALKAWERATEVANALAQRTGLRSQTVYHIACIFSLASAAAKDDAKLSNQYALRALDLLREAVKKGFKDVAHMKKDPDLDPLRNRDDFKKLLAQLEAGDGKKGP
jgi:tetratricopeptide (TPR) repeat protein